MTEEIFAKLEGSMSKRSIQTKLTTVLIAVAFLGMAAVFLLNYFVMRNNILEELLARTRNAAEVEAQKMNNWFENQITFTDTLGTALAQIDDRDLALQMLLEQAKQNEDYLTIFFGLSDDTGVFSDNWPDFTKWKATKRPWYQDAIANKGKVIITVPYQDTLTKHTVITVTKDMGKFGNLGAAIGVDVNVSTIVEAINHVETQGGYAFLVGQDGHIVAHHDKRFIPVGDAYKSMKDDPAYAKVFPATQQIYTITDYDGVKRYLFPCTIESSGWILYVAVPYSSVSKAINPDTRTIVIAALFILAASFVVSWIVRRLVVKPLLEVVKAGEKLVEGNLDIALKSNANDEIGQLTRQFGVIVENTKKQTKVLEAVSSENFSVCIEARSSYDTMNIAIQKMIEKMNRVLLDMKGSADQVSSSTKHISSGAQTLAQGATEQASTVQQLSASVTKIAEKTKANAEMAGRAAKLADAIKHDAEKGSRQMGEMVVATEEINQASQSISKVIKVIDDIAFQTNLLALNAAVEAARAGQHGKGFAVVAEEVRNLATKSAEAAQNTGKLIADSIGKAELGANIAKETAASLQEIVTGINESNQIVSEIAHASEEQSASIGEINSGIDQVARIVQQNSSTAVESASASEELNGQADILRDLISQFKLKV